jgi:bifunctional DNA-binding transcriptional regulator/antitoxin component of YhaV-PrlF toxin-antitoxin module
MVVRTPDTPTMVAMFERRTTVRLRPKNQLTLPEPIARAIGSEAGDRFFVSVEGPGRVVLERVPKSFAGALAGLWGTQEEIDAEIRAGRDEWDEREHRLLGDVAGR